MNTIATEKEKTIQSIYELRVEYPNKLRDWGRHDADEWFSTQLGFIFDHIASVAKQEGREEAIREWDKAIKLSDTEAGDLDPITMNACFKISRDELTGKVPENREHESQAQWHPAHSGEKGEK